MAEFNDKAVNLADAVWTKEAGDQAAQSQVKASGAAPNDPLLIRFWSELKTVVPPDRLVRKVLGTTSLALVYGEPQSGKTFLVADLGMHIARGCPWFGRKVTAGAVVYVACEGVTGISNRIAAYRQYSAKSPWASGLRSLNVIVISIGSLVFR
jgi:RecA-family ATPase